ncbi:hypothetical protein GF366_02795 [Candidatus Peregrinibacteria bacterium]|nr:hypothetical protein [Candidatus Peregrinibacteria bacterium]
MISVIKFFLRLIIGILSLILGITGFVIPLLPGWLLIFFGIAMISPRNGKKGYAWLKKKMKMRKKQKTTQTNE